MQNEPLFSIITPTYKRPELLLRCVNSVLQQTYKHWEMIIIDDDPISNTEESLSHLISSREDILYQRNQENIGANRSRNKGLDTAKGDYIVFLDDDDFLNARALETMYMELQRSTQRHWLFSNCVTRDGAKITHVEKYNESYSYIDDYLFGRKIRGDGTHCIARILIGDNRFPSDIKNGGEWEFFVRLPARIYTYDYPSKICEYLPSGLTETITADCKFLHEQYRRMIRIAYQKSKSIHFMLILKYIFSYKITCPILKISKDIVGYATILSSNKRTRL